MPIQVRSSSKTFRAETQLRQPSNTAELTCRTGALQGATVLDAQADPNPTAPQSERTPNLAALCNNQGTRPRPSAPQLSGPILDDKPKNLRIVQNLCQTMQNPWTTTLKTIQETQDRATMSQWHAPRPDSRYTRHTLFLFLCLILVSCFLLLACCYGSLWLLWLFLVVLVVLCCL